MSILELRFPGIVPFTPPPGPPIPIAEARDVHTQAWIDRGGLGSLEPGYEPQWVLDGRKRSLELQTVKSQLRAGYLASV